MTGEDESNLEKQMKAVADTVLASLDGDEELQGQISSAVSTALGAVETIDGPAQAAASRGRSFLFTESLGR